MRETLKRGGRAAALILFAACSDAPEADRPAGPGADDGDSGGTLVIAEAVDIEKPMPLVFSTTVDGDLVDVLYMGVTRGAWRDGRYVALLADESPLALAESREVMGADSLAYRYRLRSGPRWSDGRPVTAHDVEWTFRAIQDTATASPRLHDIVDLDSVRAEGEQAVVFYFSRRSPAMETVSTVPVAPRHVYAEIPRAELRTHRSVSDPAGLVVSGPFRIASWRPRDRVVLVPNPTFTPAPRLDGIVIRVIPDLTTRLTELRRGAVDVLHVVPAERVEPLRQAIPGLQVMKEEGRYWDYLAYNPRRVPAFRDVRVRRALGLALDVEGMLRGLGVEEYTEPAAGPFGPIFRHLQDPQRLAPVRRDTAAARRLLAEAGWRDRDGDGVLERDGRPLRFTLRTNVESPRRREVQQIVQRQWREVGVDARLEQADLSTFVDRLLRKDYEAALGGWGVALQPDLGVFFRPEAPFNIVSLEDDTAQEMIRRAAEAPTAEAAAPLWRAAAARVVELQPYTWLYHYDILSVALPRVRGMHVDPYGMYQNAWEWWIPAGERLPRDRRAPAADTTAAPAAP